MNHIYNIITNENGEEQLTIDNKLAFYEGNYLSGESYKFPILIKKEVAIKANKIQLKKFPHNVCEFNYNGFMGTHTEEKLMKYKAKFIRWSGDPGVAIMMCSDNIERNIPTYAIDYSFLLPKDETKQEDKLLFGRGSKS